MILLQVRNPIARLALILLPFVIFAVVYFTVIKPSTDTANQAVRTTTEAVSQQLDEARKDAPAAAQKSIDDASKLTDCVAKAGTDTSALADCQAAAVGG
jgi:hypothetical protein